MKTYLVPLNYVCYCPQAKKMCCKHQGTGKPGFLATPSCDRTDALLTPLSPCPSLYIMLVPWNKRRQMAFGEIQKQSKWIPKPISTTVLLIYSRALHSPTFFSCCHIPKDSYQHGNCHYKSGVPYLDFTWNKVTEMRCKKTSSHYHLETLGQTAETMFLHSSNVLWSSECCPAL